jgi:hypothetical protein
MLRKKVGADPQAGTPVPARILRSKMIIIALARDPGRDKPCPYFANLQKLTFQCNKWEGII